MKEGNKVREQSNSIASFSPSLSSLGDYKYEEDRDRESEGELPEKERQGEGGKQSEGTK